MILLTEVKELVEQHMLNTLNLKSNLVFFITAKITQTILLIGLLRILTTCKEKGFILFIFVQFIYPCSVF